MNLYEALAEVKSLKAKLDQLSEFRKESNNYDEGTEPEFKFDDLTKDIDDASESLVRLKLAIQSVNMENTVEVEGEEMKVSRAILELSSTRDKLGHVSEMLKSGRRGLLDYERKSDDPRQVAQKPKRELLALQDKYRRRKNALDAAIQEANTRLTVSA